MKINVTPRIQSVDPRLYELLRELATQVNGISEGTLAATYNAQTAAPTTGRGAKGDFIRNSDPQELGSATSKYVIFGWVCTVSGNPGTWVQCRFLTGN